MGARILETLNTHHDFPGNVIIVSEANHMPNSVDLSLAGVAQKLQQELVIELTAINHDIENILEREAKPKYNIYAQQNINHQKIKPHKAKHTIPIRKTQRKK
ncbi:MAG: hypothetical protein WCL02_07465 [bacterium]